MGIFMSLKAYGVLKGKAIETKKGAEAVRIFKYWLVMTVCCFALL